MHAQTNVLCPTYVAERCQMTTLQQIYITIQYPPVYSHSAYQLHCIISVETHEIRTRALSHYAHKCHNAECEERTSNPVMVIS